MGRDGKAKFGEKRSCILAKSSRDTVFAADDRWSTPREKVEHAGTSEPEDTSQDTSTT